ncbi:MAG TPA: hypothetical protein VF152_03370, partial [Acidimicrobiia bacterium]
MAPPSRSRRRRGGGTGPGEDGPAEDGPAEDGIDLVEPDAGERDAEDEEEPEAPGWRFPLVAAGAAVLGLLVGVG